MHWLSALLPFIIIGLCFRRFIRSSKSDRNLFGVYLVLKIAAGWLIGYWYIGIQGEGDTIRFFENIRLAGQTIWENNDPDLYKTFLSGDLEDGNGFLFTKTYGPRAYFFNRVVSLISGPFYSSYAAIAALLSMVSALLSWPLITKLRQDFPGLRSTIFVAFALVPSVLFWSVGLLKESLSFGLVCFVIYTTRNLASRFSLGSLLGLVLALLPLFFLKYYVFAVLVLFVFGFVIWQRLSSSRLKWLAIPAMVVVLFAISHAHPNLGIAVIMKAIVINHDATLAIPGQGQAIEFNELKPELISFIKNTPRAVWGFLVGPLPTAESTIWQMAYGCLRLTWLGLFIWALIVGVQKRISFSHELGWALGFTLLLGVMLTFSSPNVGSLSRYRVVSEPFLWILVLYPFEQVFRKMLWIDKDSE